MQELITNPRDLFNQLTPTHAARVTERVRKPAERAKVRLPVLGVTDAPPVQLITRAQDGRWLVASRFDADPATVTRGATYAPPSVIRRLDALIEADVKFDEIYIFDEIAAEWEPGQSVPETRPLSEWRATRAVAAQEMIFAAGAAALSGLVASSAAIGRGAAAVGSAVVSLDPALIGGVRDPVTDRWAWLLIAKWDEVRG